MVYIDIANYDDTLVCWMIPFLIVVAKLLILEVVDDRHQADRITLTILTVRIKLLEIALKHTRAWACSQSPFLVDNATLLVNLFRVEGKTISPVAKDEQTRVESALTSCRYVVDIVNSLVDAGVGIQVATKLHADRLAIADEVVAWEIVCAIEAHMLKEVSQTTLTFFFLY